MAVVNGYATLAELKAWTGEEKSDLDPIYEAAIEAASRAIDAACSRTFYEASGTRRFDTDDCHVLAIDDASVITAVATDDNADGVYETVWAASDYQALVNPGSAPEQRPYRTLRAVAGRTFPRPRWGGRVQLVEVTATWGWPAIPDAIHQACLIHAARLVKRRNSPEGVTGFGNEFGLIRITRQGDPDVHDLINPYDLTVLMA